MVLPDWEFYELQHQPARQDVSIPVIVVFSMGNQELSGWFWDPFLKIVSMPTTVTPV